MTFSLQSQIVELTASFTHSILETIRDSSLNELTAIGPSSPRLLPSGRLHRRSLEEIGKVLDSVVALLKRHPEGLRAEHIRRELGVLRKELPRVLKDGLTSKVIRATGEKRAMTYFVS